ncbi:MAG TPA: hypothetical protein VF592_11470 [Sphingomonas sp.]
MIIPEIILGISLLFGFPISGWPGIALGVAFLFAAAWTFAHPSRLSS